MNVFRGLNHAHMAQACAVTIGNFDGVHRGHQAMIALLRSEAAHRGMPSCVLSFEPHPRDYFAARNGQPELAPARIATLRDKLTELERCGVDQAVILPFNAKLASVTPQAFIEDVLLRGLKAKYVLVGDDFRFGAKRAGDYATLDAQGQRLGFDVARMQSYEVHGLRVSSSAVREALATGRMQDAAKLLGRPYSISGHVVHGRKLGRKLGKDAHLPGGFRTLNLRFSSKTHAWNSAASGIFCVRVHGLGEQPLSGVANLGVRPSLDTSDINGGRVLLETHILDWPATFSSEDGYGKIIRVELLHKLHDELKYDGLHALTEGIARDVLAAHHYFSAAPAAIGVRI
jgi:riboflavin kinase / FMN adenylyltransferase